MSNKVMVTVLKYFFYFFFLCVGFISMFIFASFSLSDFYEFSYRMPAFSEKEKIMIEKVRQNEIDEGNFSFFNWVGYKVEKNDLGYLVYMYPGDGDNASLKMFLFAMTNKICCGQKKYQLDHEGNIISNKKENKKDYPLDSSILVDTRDGNRYRTKEIFNRVWMLDNLNYKPEEASEYELYVIQNKIWHYKKKKLSFCPEYKESNCRKYGRLYDYETAISVCPEGWRNPTYEEWESLNTFRDSSFVEENAGKMEMNYNGEYELIDKEKSSYWWALVDSTKELLHSLYVFSYDTKENKIRPSSTPCFGLASVRCIKK